MELTARTVVSLCCGAMRTGADRTLELLAAQVGRPLAEVETPVAVVDLDRLEANLQDLQSYASGHGIALWPHTKTHKSPEIGLRQLELGPGPDSREDGRGGGLPRGRRAAHPRALPAVRPSTSGSASRASQPTARISTVAVDSLAPAEGLSAALTRTGAGATLLVEMDVGLHRTGQTTAAGARALAQSLSGLPALEVAGISCYPGHCRGDAETVRARVADARRAAAGDA